MNKIEIAKETKKKYSERLESAEILYKSYKYNDSISRTYYALLDAIRGLLEIEGKGAKSHKGAIIKFHNLYIKTKKINRKYSKIISRMVKLREEADYSFKLDITKNEAKLAINDVKELLKEIDKQLKELSS